MAALWQEMNKVTWLWWRTELEMPWHCHITRLTWSIFWFLKQPQYWFNSSWHVCSKFMPISIAMKGLYAHIFILGNSAQMKLWQVLNQCHGVACHTTAFGCTPTWLRLFSAWWHRVRMRRRSLMEFESSIWHSLQQLSKYWAIWWRIEPARAIIQTVVVIQKVAP